MDQIEVSAFRAGCYSVRLYLRKHLPFPLHFRQHFTLVHTSRVIHEATGLTAPGHSMALTGTIPENPLSHECGEYSLKTVPDGSRQPSSLMKSAVSEV